MKIAQQIENERLVDLYLQLKQIVISNGFSYEIEWQDSRDLKCLTESEFLQESAWVILNTGMREKVIRGLFQDISDAFMSWTSAFEIISNANICESRALEIFGHKRKISAILSLCSRVHESSFQDIKNLIKGRGVSYLMEFDFIGPITCYHLAKNIGLDVVKPDRHLMRIAEASNHYDPHDLCNIISEATGDKLSVVDIVLWRYATLDTDYVSCFEH